MRALLTQKEHVNFQPVYVKTHSNVYRNVLFNLMPAGGGVNNTLKREEEGIKSQLRILYTTQPSSPHPLCVHPRVTQEDRLLLQQAILQMAGDAKYKEILNAIQIPNPVKADYFKEYQPLQKLNLEKFIVSEHE